MATATTVVTFTQIAMIGAVALGCATASRESGKRGDATIRSPSESVVRDRSLTPLPSRASDALTAAELSATSGVATATAYDVVVRLRPGFLSPRDARTGIIASGGVLPAVFIDGVFVGEVDALRSIAAPAVAEMQYVRPFDALHRYGPDYRGGVIVVRLRR
jgi:hypothetical protein